MSNPRGDRWYLRFFRPNVAADLIIWLLLAGLPFAIRGFHLQDVPSIDEPFDVNALGDIEIAPEDNAYALYREAAKHLVPMGLAARDEYDNSLKDTPPAIGEALKEAIDSNQTALALFQEASERPDFKRYEAEEAAANSSNAAIRDLVRLTDIEALLLHEAGDVDSAWSRYHSILRCSRHLGRNSSTNGRLIGRGFHVCAIRRIVRWAESPLVDAELLRRALSDARATYRMTPPISTALKYDYLWSRHVLDTRSLQDSGTNQEIVHNRLEWEGRWFFGEPELGRTVVRAAFTNWLSQCDKPRFERSPQNDWGLFSSPTAASAGTAEMAPELVERLLRRSLVARPLVCPHACVFEASDTERAWQGLLELLLATHIHFRETGAFPGSLDTLVGPVFDVLPIDPFGPPLTALGTPVRYRRESDPADGVTIWSIGPDGVDDDGLLRHPTSIGHDHDRGDILLSIKPPR